MTRRLLLLLLCLASGSAPGAAPKVSALGAVRLLPKEAAAALALIEGYDGRPEPDRWHLVVHDPKDPRGVHEYVVAGGELVASRAFSQFAETVQPEEVIGAPAVKIDSDRVLKLAQEYARVNQLPAAAFHYELKKLGEGAVPLWRVTCVDAQGATLGVLVVTATKGFVISHEGFAAEPGEPARPKAEEVVKHSEPRKPPRAREAEMPVATPLPAEEEPRPGLMQRAGGSLQRIFTGR